jgi:hypothetical protein
MQLDAARLAEAREWLSKAALDLRAAEFEFTAAPPLTGDIVFHCQQLSEKANEGLPRLARRALPQNAQSH